VKSEFEKMTSLPFGQGYCDLNIPISAGQDGNSKIDVVRRALSLGFQTLALSVTINQEEIQIKKEATIKKE